MHPLRFKTYEKIIDNNLVISGVLRKNIVNDELRIGTPCNVLISNNWKGYIKTNEKLGLTKYMKERYIEKVDNWLIGETDVNKSIINILMANYCNRMDNNNVTIILHSPINSGYSPTYTRTRPNNVLYNSNVPFIKYNKNHLRYENYSKVFNIENIIKKLEDKRSITYIFDVDSNNYKNMVDKLYEYVENIQDKIKNNLSFYSFGNAERTLINTISISFARIEDYIPVFEKIDGLIVEIFAANSNNKVNSDKSYNCWLSQTIFTTEKIEKLFRIDGSDVAWFYKGNIRNEISRLYRILRSNVQNINTKENICAE
jgi:hypothetical protein